MKKLLSLILAAAMTLSFCACGNGANDAEVSADGNIVIDELKLQFVPSRDAEVIVTGTKNLPELLKAALLEEGYEVGSVEITVGSSYEATGEALAAGSIDIGWLPGGTYALYSEEVDVVLTATRAGLSNDSTNPAEWNGDANATQPTDNQVTYYRSLIYATPSEYGKYLANKVNNGEKLTWDDVNNANWGVMNTSSSAGYIYPTIWLMDNYGKKISDLSHVTTMSSYATMFAQGAAESLDIILCYADGRRDYAEAWTLPTTSQDKTGIAGYGRTDSIWNELNVIGVTDGIYNDTVAITKADKQIYNDAFKKAIQNAMIKIINTEEGAEIFSVYSHSGYAIATDADYEAARKALTVVTQ